MNEMLYNRVGVHGDRKRQPHFFMAYSVHGLGIDV